MTFNRSAEELRMRELIVSRLRMYWPDARIIHELPVRYSTNRIDLAAITPTQIIAVEIKSSRDVCDRLEAQLRAFQPVTAYLIVALAPKWNQKLPQRTVERDGYTDYVEQRTEAQEIINRVDTCIQTWTVDADSGEIDGRIDRWSRPRIPWSAQMLHMLHVVELRYIAAQHRIANDKRSTHLTLVEQCAKLMTGAEIAKAVCGALRARCAFATGTDAAVTREAAE